VAGVQLTDTHCHLDSARFDPDREAVIARARDAGVRRILVPALDLESSQRILTLVEGARGLFAAVGIHPTSPGEVAASHIETLRTLVASGSVVAIGEIGLDYYWVHEPSLQSQQQAALRMQLDLAAACGLPVVLHMREKDDADHGACAEDMLRIVESWVRALRADGAAIADRPGVLHSFSGTLETAMAAIELGFYIGVTGPITFPTAAHRRAVISRLPIERLLIETDSPYLAPQAHRGRRNEPAFVAHIADRIAQIQARPQAQVAEVTSRNAARLFAWGEPD